MLRPLPRAVVLALLLPAASGPTAAQGSDPTGVVTPPLWYRGDTHVHSQLCTEPAVPDLTTTDVLDLMVTEELAVGCLQVWGWKIDETEYLEQFAPLITGVEDPITVGDPERVLQYGLELSDFPGDQFGHIQCLGISDGFIPVESVYPSPVLDFCRGQEGALTGFAHVFWPTSYNPFEVPVIEDVGIGAPVEAALGKVDFVETPRAILRHGYGWEGLFYKLLRCGIAVTPTGGRDNSCAGSDVVTYARIPETPLTFDGWLDAIRAGRTVIADGKHIFVDLEVEGSELGSQVYLDGPRTVSVTATLRVGDAVVFPGQKAGRVRILLDGVEVAGEPYDFGGGGELVVPFEIPVERSGWLAAKVHADDVWDGGAHTAAIYVFVANQPICNAVDAEYFEGYLDLLKTTVVGGAFEVGDQVPEIVDHIESAQRVYRAVAACDQPLPAGVERFGASKPSCTGPVHLGMSGPPSADGGFSVHVLNAPPEATGLLLVAAGGDFGGSGVPGVPLYVDLAQLLIAVPITSHAGGFTELSATIGPAAVGQSAFLQALWLDPEDCPNPVGGNMSASDALRLTFQP